MRTSSACCWRKRHMPRVLWRCVSSARTWSIKTHDASAGALLELLTPVAKTWSSEFGLAANDLAIQIHGGYGYTRDFDVEQLYRDNRLNPIHEGTTGIQALDLLGRKILRGDSAALETVTAKITSCCDQARSHPALAPARRCPDSRLAGGQHNRRCAAFDRCCASVGQRDTVSFSLRPYGCGVALAGAGD